MALSVTSGMVCFSGSNPVLLKAFGYASPTTPLNTARRGQLIFLGAQKSQVGRPTALEQFPEHPVRKARLFNRGFAQMAMKITAFHKLEEEGVVVEIELFSLRLRLFTLHLSDGLDHWRPDILCRCLFRVRVLRLHHASLNNVPRPGHTLHTSNCQHLHTLQHQYYRLSTEVAVLVAEFGRAGPPFSDVLTVRGAWSRPGT